MHNRRWAIVAGLAVIEVWLAGLMLRSIAGGAHRSHAALPLRLSSAPSRPVTTTRSVAPQTVESGPTPNVVIDDDDALLTVTVRPGTTVEARERTQRAGWFSSPAVGVRIEKTVDGVRIARQSNGVVFEIGMNQRQLDVIVPPATRLDVRNAGATTVSGVRGPVALHSDNGSIMLNDQVGSVKATTDNGRIVLTNVAAPTVSVATHNGRLTFDRVQADVATVNVNSGRIEITRSLLHGGKIETNSGRISLDLDVQSDVTISAHTASEIIARSPLTLVRGDATDDDAPASVQIGNGAGRLEVGSDNGSITIFAREHNPA